MAEGAEIEEIVSSPLHAKIQASDSDGNEVKPITPRCYLCKRTEGEVTFFRSGDESDLKTAELVLKRVVFNASRADYIFHLCEECLCLLECITDGILAEAHQLSRN